MLARGRHFFVDAIAFLSWWKHVCAGVFMARLTSCGLFLLYRLSAMQAAHEPILCAHYKCRLTPTGHAYLLLVVFANMRLTVPPLKTHTRTHTTKRNRRAGTFLKPHTRGQRRPRDLRVRALDPDHFTCPPPAHGAMHQQQPGTTPAEGHASIVVESPVCRLSPGPPPAPPAQRSHMAGASGGGARRERTDGREGRAVAAALAAAEAAEAAAAGAATAGREPRPGTMPGIHEMYHLDAVSVGAFGEAVAAATRALEALLAHVPVGGGGRGDGGGGRRGPGGGRGGNSVGDSGDGGGGDTRYAVDRAILPPPGVASLLLGRMNGGGGGGSIVEAIGDVRGRFRELVVAAAALGAVVPCAPEGAGASFRAVELTTLLVMAVDTVWSR